MATATVITNAGKGLIASRLLGTTPAVLEPKFIGIGTGGTTAAVTDTALTTEVETRATGTGSIVTTTITNDTYQSVGTITATAGRTIIEAGMFTASTVGTMALSATFPAIGLLTGDSLQITGKIQAT